MALKGSVSVGAGTNRPKHVVFILQTRMNMSCAIFGVVLSPSLYLFDMTGLATRSAVQEDVSYNLWTRSITTVGIPTVSTI